MSKLRQMFYKTHDKKWLADQLNWAAYKNNLKKAKDLIAAGAPLSKTDALGYTPLHWAAYQGHSEIVRCLATAGATLEITNVHDNTPLDSAVINQKSASIGVLLESGAHITNFVKSSIPVFNADIQNILLSALDKQEKEEKEAARRAAHAIEETTKNREAWLKAGMPLTEPLVIKNKPLKFNKKPQKLIKNID